MFKYLSLDSLEKIIVTSLEPLNTEYVDVGGAVGRFLAEDLISPRDLPENDISLVDGYSLSECGSNTFRIVDSDVLGPCEARYVRTGEPLPLGAVAVAPVESIIVTENGVLITHKSYESFHEVLKRGLDISKGDVISVKGNSVSPTLVKTLLDLGISRIRVYRKPRVLIVPVGTEFSAGLRLESNSVIVKNMCESVGSYAVVHNPIEDSVDVIKHTIEENIDFFDVVVTIGGASLGDKDLVLSALLEHCNGKLLARGIAVQPGRVTSLVILNNKPIVVLPGLIQSTISGTIFLLQPILRVLQGSTPRACYLLGYYKNLSTYIYSGRFTSFTRIRFVRLVNYDAAEVEIIEAPSSVRKAILESHGFVIMKPGVTRISNGEFIEVFRTPGLYT